MIDAVDLGAENDERMAKLREALALGGGFQLVIVQVEPGEQREEVLRRLAGWSGRSGVPQLELVRLPAGESPVIRLAGAHAGVILVGLEAEGPDRAERTRQMVTELNWSRDQLPDLVHGPLLLVVSQRVQTELFEQAPDFYSWRTHSTSIAPQPRRPGRSLPLHWLGIEDPDPGDPDVLETMIAQTEALRPPALRELGQLYARLASARSRRGDDAAADDALDAAYRACASAGTPDDRINLMLLCVTAARQRGRVDEACAWLHQVQHEAREASPTPIVAIRIHLLEGLLEIARGHREVAAVALRSAIEAARALGDPRVEADALVAQSSLTDQDHDVVVLMHRALDLYRQAGDPTREIYVLLLLAMHAAARGRSDDAEAYGREALARAEASGSADAMLTSRAKLAQIVLDRHDLDLADRLLRVVVPAAGGSAIALAAEARAALAQRRSDDAGALRHLQDALEAYRRGRDTAAVARVSLDLAELAARTGQSTLALTGFETADRLGDSRQRAIAALGLAQLVFDREEWTTELSNQLAAAAEMLIAVGDATSADIARGFRGIVLHQLGHEADARDELTTALAGFEARGQADAAVALRQMLAEVGLHSS